MGRPPYVSVTQCTGGLGPPGLAVWVSQEQWRIWLARTPVFFEWSTLLDRRTGAVVQRWEAASPAKKGAKAS